MRLVITLLACAAQIAFNIKGDDLHWGWLGLACDLTYRGGLSNMHHHTVVLILFACENHLLIGHFLFHSDNVPLLITMHMYKG